MSLRCLMEILTCTLHVLGLLYQYKRVETILKHLIVKLIHGKLISNVQLYFGHRDKLYQQTTTLALLASTLVTQTRSQTVTAESQSVGVTLTLLPVVQATGTGMEMWKQPAAVHSLKATTMVMTMYSLIAFSHQHQTPTHSTTYKQATPRPQAQVPYGQKTCMMMEVLGS